MLTFGDFKQDSGVERVAGVCVDSLDFQKYTNQAVPQLMRRGNFFATVREIEVCTYNNCVVWPRFVGTLLASNICGVNSVQKDFWYRFLPVGNYDWGTIQGGGGCGNVVAETTGLSPVFNNIACGKNYYIRAYPSVRADIGKTITIFGVDENGQVIRTKRLDGTYQDGVVLTLAVEFATTPFKIRTITRVIKDVTQGVVRLYQFDTANNVLLDCAVYQPDEKSPSYVTSTVWGRPRTACGCSSIKTLFKMKFIPVKYDWDEMGIDNPEAVKLFIQAIKQGEAGNQDQKRGLELDAIRELNYELRDKFPIEQFTVSSRPFGTASFNRVTAGFI